MAGGLLIAAGPARANDTGMGGMGSDLVPLSTAAVRMQSEDILIRHLGPNPESTSSNVRPSAWEVSAEYVFVNTTERAVEMQVGFPEYACEAEPEEGVDPMCDPQPLHFQSMRTSIDGKPVEHRKGRIKQGHPWAPRLGRVWLYDARFEPGRPTRITHHYRVQESLISDGTSFSHYVTRTGAAWAGSIGKARFRIRVPERVRSVFAEPEKAGLRVTTHQIAVEGVTVGEILLEAEDWEPDTDLRFGFTPWSGGDLNEVQAHAEAKEAQALPADARCTRITDLWIRGSILGEPTDGTPPRPPTEEELQVFVQTGIGSPRLCRNYVFAMYGRRFEDEALNRFYYGPAGFEPGSWPFAPFEPNPGYDQSMLSRGDWATLELIAEVQRRIDDPPPPAEPRAASEEPSVADCPPGATCGDPPPGAPSVAPSTPATPGAAGRTASCGGCTAAGGAQVPRTGLALFVVACARLRRRRSRSRRSKPTGASRSFLG